METSFAQRPGLRLSLKNSITQIEVVDHPFVADEINLPSLVRAERGNTLRCLTDLFDRFDYPSLLRQSPDAMRGVVPADIDAIKRGVLIAAINVPARDRIPVTPP